MPRCAILLVAILQAVAIPLLVSHSCVLSQETKTRLAVPDEAAQKEALRLVGEIYKADYDAAKTTTQKQALVQKLLRAQSETTEAASRYVLLRVARDLAAQTGDLALALEAVEALAASYQVDAFAMKCEALETVSRSAGAATTQKAIAEGAAKLLDEAVGRDDFEAATRLERIALAAARKTRDGVLVNKVVAHTRRIEKAARAYRDVKTALVALEKDPADPEANLTVGRYLCLVKGDWEKGLAMLALGSDESLKTLAVKELKGVSEPAAWVALGDGWWDLAQGEEGTAKGHLEARAALWYRKALPDLTGLAKVRVEGRLEKTSQAAQGLTGTSHYFAPDNLKNVRFLDYVNGTWQNNAAQSFRVEKVADGYRVTCDANTGHDNRLIVFTKESPLTRKLVASFTVEEGRYGISLRPRDLSPGGTSTFLDAGRTYQVEMWIEGGAARGTVNGEPMVIKYNDAVNYGFFSFVSSRRSVAVFHKLVFVDLK